MNSIFLNNNLKIILPFGFTSQYHGKKTFNYNIFVRAIKSFSFSYVICNLVYKNTSDLIFSINICNRKIYSLLNLEYVEIICLFLMHCAITRQASKHRLYLKESTYL
jgi:hypothetical protein